MFLGLGWSTLLGMGVRCCIGCCSLIRNQTGSDMKLLFAREYELRERLYGFRFRDWGNSAHKPGSHEALAETLKPYARNRIIVPAKM